MWQLTHRLADGGLNLLGLPTAVERPRSRMSPAPERFFRHALRVARPAGPASSTVIRSKFTDRASSSGAWMLWQLLVGLGLLPTRRSCSRLS
jgi:hypothetical protein